MLGLAGKARTVWGRLFVLARSLTKLMYTLDDVVMRVTVGNAIQQLPDAAHL